MSFFKALGQKLIHNVGLKILSIALAFLIWLVVVSIDNPVKTQVFTSIPVSVENADVMEKAGQAYEVAGSSRTVSVSVKAERSILSQLSRDNFTASIDLSEYSNGRVPIEVKATKYADRIISVTPRTAYASVSVEELEETQFSIEAQITGDAPEGYTVGDVDVANNLVKVSGPESIVSTIDKAVVTVSAKGMTRDIRTDSPIIFYDKNGRTVDTADLELSMTETSVTVSIWNTKEVPVTYSFSGTPADGYAATGAVSGTITSVVITGASKYLSKTDSIDIPKKAVNIAEASENVTASVDIQTYLPDGISFADPDFKSVSDVTVIIEPFMTKNVEVPTSNIKVEDVPEGMTATVGGVGDNVVVSVKGINDLLSVLDPKTITGSVNMGNVAKQQDIKEWTAGVYDAEVLFTYPTGIYAGESTVSVKILLKQSDSSDTGSSSDNAAGND